MQPLFCWPNWFRMWKVQSNCWQGLRSLPLQRPGSASIFLRPQPLTQMSGNNGAQQPSHLARRRNGAESGAGINQYESNYTLFRSNTNINKNQSTTAESSWAERTRTHSLQEPETRAGTVYLQSMIMVRVSLSLASWNGGWPQTNMKRITPRLQMSEREREGEGEGERDDQSKGHRYVLGAS